MTNRVVSYGDSAWSGLEEQRGDLVRFLGRRCRDSNEVDDIVQETFLRAARYRTKLEHPDRLRAWISSIAANILSDRVRREGRMKRQLGEDFLLDMLPSPDDATASNATDSVVRCGNWVVDRDTALFWLSEELQGLARPDRELLTGYYAQGGSCRAVATRCEVSPSVVKVRLFRARYRLLRAVARRLALAGQLPLATPRRSS